MDKIETLKNNLYLEDLNNKEILEILISKLGLKQSFINNRRYLCDKYSFSNFIRKIVDENCKNINIVVDIFSGTGVVSNTFKYKIFIKNDILYSNYISNYTWFGNEK